MTLNDFIIAYDACGKINGLDASKKKLEKIIFKLCCQALRELNKKNTKTKAAKNVEETPQDRAETQSN